jgi:hypothetical protein
MTGFTLNALTSIHGKRIGLNSTGALILDHSGAQMAAAVMSSADILQNSSALEIKAFGSTDTAIPGRAQTITSTIASTLEHGFTALTSGANTGAITAGWEIKAPFLGAEFELYFNSTSSGIHLGATSTSVTFASSDETSDAGSTLYISGADLRGSMVRLRGISNTRWAVSYVSQSASQVNPINGVTGASTVVIG